MRVRLLAPLLVLAGCSQALPPTEPRNPASVAVGLTLTRADGSSYRMGDAVAECRGRPGHPGVEVVALTTPAVMRGREPFLRVEVAPGVTGSRSLPLAVRSRGVGPSDVVIVGVDPWRRNGLSGSAGGSQGTVRVIEATCHPEPRLTFVIRARLGSAAGRRPVDVVGGLASIPGDADRG